MPPSEPPETEHAAAPPNASRAGAVQSRHDERQHWKRLLFEVVLLVASAALALVVNDWNNERERRQLAHRVLEELKLEVQQNRQEVDAELGYHEKMAQSFRASREALARGEQWEQPADFDGLHQILFQRAAYEAAMMSQTLPHLAPNTLSVLAALYTQQDEYTQNLRLYAAATLQSDDKDASRDLRLTENCLKQMAASERRLSGLLDKAKDAIDAELDARG